MQRVDSIAGDIGLRRPTARGRTASLLLVLLTLAYAVAMIDRTILVLLIGPIEHDLNLSDTQFGVLQGVAFAVFYVVAGLPIGALVDRFPRVLVIGAGMLLWSSATVASAFAGGFGSLFAARTAVAVGEASLNPAAYSLFSDVFARERLGRAIGIFSTGAAIGTGLAYLVGGALLSRAHGLADVVVPVLGPVRIWQLAFLVAGLPGIVLALLIARLQEPARRAAHDVGAAGAAGMAKFFAGHRRTLLLIFTASGCQTLLLYAFMTWSPALLLRSHGLSGGQAGLILGLSNTVLGISGFYFGGYLADRWWRAGRRDAHMQVGFWAHVMILPIGLIAALAAPTAVAVPAVCFLNFLQFGTGPATIAGLQLVTPPHLRGRTSALLMMATTLGGVGLGPVGVALLNDHVFGPQAVGRSLAVVVAVVAPLAILLFHRGRRALADDLAKLDLDDAGRLSATA